MSKTNKILAFIAVISIFLGGVIFVISMASLNFDFTKLNNKNLIENTIQLNEEFNNISIDVDTSDINFILNNEENKVVVKETEKEKHEVKVIDDTLTITLINDKELIDYIGINFYELKVDIYLSNSSYNDLLINNSTGDVNIPNYFTFDNIDINGSTGDVKVNSNVNDELSINLTTGDIEINNINTNKLDLNSSTGDIELNSVNVNEDINIKVSTGDVSLDNVNCNNLNSNGTTGDLEMNDVVVTNKMYLERDTGDIEFFRCDAKEIIINTTTGDVKGSLLSDKLFDVTTNTGDKHIPSSKGEDICKITTDTGDIYINIV